MMERTQIEVEIDARMQGRVRGQKKIDLLIRRERQINHDVESNQIWGKMRPEYETGGECSMARGSHWYGGR
jgi:hypothetical protein